MSAEGVQVKSTGVSMQYSSVPRGPPELSRAYGDEEEPQRGPGRSSQEGLVMCGGLGPNAAFHRGRRDQLHQSLLTGNMGGEMTARSEPEGCVHFTGSLQGRRFELWSLRKVTFLLFILLPQQVAFVSDVSVKI